MRLTNAIRKEILSKNEGFKTSTSYDSRNLSYIRDYVIEGGKVIITEVGNTSWSDSRYEKTWIADHDEELRFLRNNLNIFNS